MWVRFPTFVTALSVASLQIEHVNNATIGLHSSGNGRHQSPKIDEGQPPVANNNSGDSLFYFAVTLMCNVSGWPEPMIKWSGPRNLGDSAPSSEPNGPRFKTFTHSWSLTEKSSVSVIRDATCLDNGQYSCSASNGDSPTLETVSGSVSRKDVVLDLPCPPVRIQDLGVLSSLSSEDVSTVLDRTKALNRSDNGTFTKESCESSPSPVDTEGDIDLVIVAYHATVTIRACFIGNPKPTVELRFLNGIHAESGPALGRRSSLSNVKEQHIFKEYHRNLHRLRRSEGNIDQNGVGNDGTLPRDIDSNKSTESGNDRRVNEKNRRINGTNDEVGLTGGKLIYKHTGVLSADGNFTNNTDGLWQTEVQCSNTTSASLCVAEVKVTITRPSQYGDYELVVRNPHGETRRKYRLISRQAPLPPKDFRLENVTFDSACFSWRVGFHGGERQTFHLCCGRESEMVVNTRKSTSSEDQIEMDNFCNPVPISSKGNPVISDSENSMSWSEVDNSQLNSHCLSLLSPSTSYEAKLFSSNRYGRSNFSRAISFTTDPKPVWVTETPILSFLPSTQRTISKEKFSATITPPTTDEDFHPQGIKDSKPTDLSETATGSRQPHVAIFSEESLGDEEFSSTVLKSDQISHDLEMTKRYQDPPTGDANFDYDTLETEDEVHQDIHENEDEFLEELLFGLNDLIFGEINDIPFFQLFDIHHPLQNDDPDEKISESLTGDNLPHKTNDTVKRRNLNQNKEKTPPIHLQKLILRYSRPHAKLKLTKTEIKPDSINKSSAYFTSQVPSTMTSPSTTTTTTTVSHVLDEDLASNHMVDKYKNVALTGSIGATLVAAAVASSLVCLRQWRRHRRVKQLKQRYRQRMAEEVSVRKRYSAVPVEDANTAGTRLSSLRDGARSSPCRGNLHAPPILFPRQDLVHTPPHPPPDIQRKTSITCVSNENALYFPPSCRVQAPPPPHEVNLRNSPQKQLRPTSSTPAMGKVTNQLMKEKEEKRTSVRLSASSSPKCTKAHLTIPTITIGEDCGFSPNRPPPSTPSYLDLHADDHADSSYHDPLHEDRDLGRLRPPSHHSSYSSVRQGAQLLLRLDSSSSGATGSYFDLYEGLTSRSTRSRSPSNVYDPMTFEPGLRSNPPSRRGSRVKPETCQANTRPSAGEGNTDMRSPVEDAYLASVCRSNSAAGGIISTLVHSNCMGLPRQNSSHLDKGVVMQRDNGTASTVTDQASPQTQSPLPESDYERIVKQSTIFSRCKNLRLNHNAISMKPETSRKSFELRNLFRLSLPRDTGNIPYPKFSQNIAGSSGSDGSIQFKELRASEGIVHKSRNTSPSPRSTDQTLNSKGKATHGIRGRSVSRVPSPPALGLESINGPEEPIYVDIDDNDVVADSFSDRSDNRKYYGSINKNNSNNHSNSSNNDISNHYLVRPETELSENHPSTAMLKSPDNSESGTFVSLSSLFSRGEAPACSPHKPAQAEAEARMLSTVSRRGKLNIPDIMLCTAMESSSVACEDDTYSTIDFSDTSTNGELKCNV